jgi:HECT-domain (ubiquitin-transferase)
VAGVREIVSPAHLLALFTPAQLSSLLSGEDHYDLDDWRIHTKYTGGYTADSDTVRYFWECVRCFSPQQRAHLLQFATGSTHVPVGGFGRFLGASGPLPFTITRLDAPLHSLPLSSTCFKLLKLPPYSSLAQTRARLTTAISYGRQGFGFA